MEALKRSLMAQGSAPPSPSQKGKYRSDNTPKVKAYVPPTTSSTFSAAEGGLSALSTLQHDSNANHGGSTAGPSSGPLFAAANHPAGPSSSSNIQTFATSSTAFNLAPTSTALHGTALGDIEQQIQAMPDFVGNLADSQARDKAIEDLIAQSVAVDDAFDELKDAGVDGMKIKLMPHQIQGYRWMLRREAGRFKGGILADDMGLGKTIQALALIVGNHPDKDAATICHIKEEDTRKETTTKLKGKQPISKAIEDDEAEDPGDPVELRSKVTLIVAPVAVMNQWKREAEEKSDSLRVFIHHGTGKAANTATFKKYDVVITSYSTASSEWTAAQEGSQRTPLMKMRWLRVILDEAHNIKNHKTKQAQACYAMGDRAHSRWCLTGTPLQNNAYEMYSLIHFLAIPPFDEYPVFKEKIGEPLQSSNQNRVNWGMKRLCLVLSSILLRRTKDAQLNGKPLLNLPARNVTIMSEEFDNEEEKVFYKEWESKAQRNANREGSHIAKLVLLLRLRQATSHPFLVQKGVQSDIELTIPEASAKKPEAAGLDEDSEPDELADMFANIGITKTKCPRCQGSLSEGETLHSSGVCIECHELEQKQGVNWSGRGSTKLRILMKLLGEIEDAGQGEKTIVFSQFTSFLDLAQRALDQEGYKYVRYDGSMTNVAREAALDKIRTSSTTRVILISLGAGSTGLNLVCCSRVILMDQHWNPQIESQGFDRAHRMGQTRDVFIYKITIRDTVEDRILALQEKKKALSSAALEGSKLKKGGNKLSKKELQYLFNGGQM